MPKCRQYEYLEIPFVSLPNLSYFPFYIEGTLFASWCVSCLCI
jgi:hypothetical protein